MMGMNITDNRLCDSYDWEGRTFSTLKRTHTFTSMPLIFLWIGPKKRINNFELHGVYFCRVILATLLRIYKLCLHLIYNWSGSLPIRFGLLLLHMSKVLPTTKCIEKFPSLTLALSIWACIKWDWPVKNNASYRGGQCL